MPTAQIYTDARRAPRLETTADGVRGQRTYWVDTHNEEAALEAQGVPRVDDPWSLTRPDLIATRVAVQYVHGTDDPLTGTGGRCDVTVEYQTQGWAGRPPRPAPLLRYTEVIQSVGSETIRWDVRKVDPTFVGPPEPGSPAYPISNGQGCTREVALYTARVVTYWRPPELNNAALASLFDLAQTTNANAITLPPLHGLTGAARIRLEVGEGRYRSFATRPATGPGGEQLIELVHEIAIAPTHDWLWVVELADGSAGPQVRSQRYRSTTWPAGVF